MSRPRLVTFDVYMALLDIGGGLTQAVVEQFGLPDEDAAAFVREWRAQQMLRAASSNSLARGHTSFRHCTAVALAHTVARRGFSIDEDVASTLVAAWDRLRAWPDADAALAGQLQEAIGLALVRVEERVNPCVSVTGPILSDRNRRVGAALVTE